MTAVLELKTKKDENLTIEKKNRETWTVNEWRANKETGAMEPHPTDIPVANVDVVFYTILNNCQPNVEYGYHYIVRKLLEFYKFHEQEGCTLEFMLNNCFNGGKNRKKYYFPYYYYPMKILQKQGFIHYYGQGKFTLLPLDYQSPFSASGSTASRHAGQPPFSTPGAENKTL